MDKSDLVWTMTSTLLVWLMCVTSFMNAPLQCPCTKDSSKRRANFSTTCGSGVAGAGMGRGRRRCRRTRTAGVRACAGMVRRGAGRAARGAVRQPPFEA